MDVGSTAYLIVKSVHIVAVISWMAGIFYLPRLFVYHAEAEPGSDIASTLEVMERRLLRAIMNPAMMVTLFTGIGLGVSWWPQPWLLIKLVFVIPIFALHMLCARWWRQFAAGENRHSGKYFRVMNEVPTLAVLVIVPLVVFKPFW